MVEKYYRNFSKQIYNIQGKIVNISLIIEGIQQSLEIMLRKRNSNDNICYSIHTTIYITVNICDSDDNEISLPLTEYTEFDALNKQLSNEINFRQKIVSSKHVNFLYILFFISLCLIIVEIYLIFFNT